jgi:hypothetical protein
MSPALTFHSQSPHFLRTVRTAFALSVSFVSKYIFLYHNFQAIAHYNK